MRNKYIGRVEAGLTPEGLAEALLFLATKIRYNQRLDCVELQKDEVWIPVNDRNMQALRFEIAQKFDMPKGKGSEAMLFSKQGFYDCRDALINDNEADCFLQFLQSLEPLSISSADIEGYNLEIDKSLIDLFGAANSVYTKHSTRMIVLGAVWRAFQPGYKIDEIVVLQGAQGIGKDAYIKELVPDDKYFTDALNFHASDKDKVEITRGKVFVTASEMGGVTTTRDLENLKRWITSTSDRVRLAYRHDAEDLPRRFLVVGTTNADQPLPPDPSGNRRWVVVPLYRGSWVEPYVRERRVLFWREAMALYQAGITPNLTRDLKVSQSKRNQDLTRSDFQFEEALDKWEHTDKLYQLGEIAECVGLVGPLENWIRSSKSDQYRLADTLRSNGWKRSKMRHAGLVRNWWTPPDKEG